MCSSNRIPCSSLAWHIFVAVHSPSKVLWALHVVERLSRSLSLQQVVLVLLLCKMAKRVGKQWSFLLLGLWLAFWPQTSPLSLFDLGSVAAIGAVFAGLNSNWYPTYKATNRFMSSYQVSEKENIVKREVVEAIKNNVRELKMKDHATIISGREMAGQQWKTPWGAPVVFSGSASNTRTGRASCTRSWEVRTRTCSSKSYAVSAND